jgi:hypothetical protein
LSGERRRELRKGMEYLTCLDSDGVFIYIAVDPISSDLH